MAYFELNNDMPSVGKIPKADSADCIDTISDSGCSLSNHSDKCTSNSESTDISVSRGIHVKGDE